MSASVDFHLNKASETEIACHLSACDADFVPPLSHRVEINAYARKIASKATRFEAWSGGMLVGLVAMYCNDQKERVAYITSVSILEAWTGQGIGARLMDQCVEHAKASSMRQMRLEVAEANASAIKLYEKIGFVASKVDAPFVMMDLQLKIGEDHEPRA